jgi:hypothetical protein
MDLHVSQKMLVSVSISLLSIDKVALICYMSKGMRQCRGCIWQG